MPGIEMGKVSQQDQKIAGQRQDAHRDELL